MAEITEGLPDAELVVCDFLRAAVPGVEVATGLVGWTAGLPWLQVQRTGGAVRLNWLDQAEIAVEARAGSREAAADLIAAARAALASMPADQPAATVARTAELRGPRWMPEPDGRGSYRLEWQITMHPRRNGGRP